MDIPPANRPADAPAAAWSRDDSIATAMKRYRDAKDLRDFYDRAVAAGGMANLWAGQMALLRCSSVASSGMVGAEQRMAALNWADDKESARRDAYRSWIAPCAAFETRPLPQGEMRRSLDRLRETPGLVGEGYAIAMAAIVKQEPVTLEEQKAFLGKIVDSGDPELIGAFGSGTAEILYGSPGAGASTDIKRVVMEERAWMLAACDLGADCGRNSLIWFNGCMSTGNCADNNYGAEALGAVGAANMPVVLKRRDEIVAAIRARNLAALGL